MFAYVLRFGTIGTIVKRQKTLSKRVLFSVRLQAAG